MAEHFTDHLETLSRATVHHHLCWFCHAGQAFLPPSLVPEYLVEVKQDYMKQSNDHIVGQLATPEMAWFYMTVILELAWQVPSFILGIYGLVRGESESQI